MVDVGQNGRRRKMTKLQLYVRSASAKAAQGSLKHMEYLLANSSQGRQTSKQWPDFLESDDEGPVVIRLKMTDDDHH